MRSPSRSMRRTIVVRAASVSVRVFSLESFVVRLERGGERERDYLHCTNLSSHSMEKSKSLGEMISFCMNFNLPFICSMLFAGLFNRSVCSAKRVFSTSIVPKDSALISAVRCDTHVD
jgi:hypothetical protein